VVVDREGEEGRDGRGVGVVGRQRRRQGGGNNRCRGEWD
jgi:hypothetical protein